MSGNISTGQYIIATKGAMDVLSHPALLKNLDSSYNPLSCLLLNPNIIWFSYNKVTIGYFIYKRYCICIGGILGPADNHENAVEQFFNFCDARKLTPIFIHLSEADCKILSKKGYNINFIGQSYSLNIRGFSCSGRLYQQLRYKINRAKKAAIRVQRVESQAYFEKIKPELDAINLSWLKGKKVNELHGLITDFSSVEIYSGEHRVYIARQNDQLVAYIIYTRTRGRNHGWYHNLSRRLSVTPDGTMQLINQHAINDFAKEGAADYLHFGFTPLVEPTSDEIFRDSVFFHKIVQWLSKRGGVFYPARSQRQYKMSWRPDIISPEYIAIPDKKSLQSIWVLLKSTRCI